MFFYTCSILICKVPSQALSWVECICDYIIYGVVNIIKPYNLKYELIGVNNYFEYFKFCFKSCLNQNQIEPFFCHWKNLLISWIEVVVGMSCFGSTTIMIWLGFATYCKHSLCKHEKLLIKELFVVNINISQHHHYQHNHEWISSFLLIIYISKDEMHSNR
jgi:hypothetical protein